MIRKCKKCQIEKQMIDFRKNKYGYSHKCKSCICSEQKDIKKSNEQKHILLFRQLQLENPSEPMTCNKCNTIKTVLDFLRPWEHSCYECRKKHRKPFTKEQKAKRSQIESNRYHNNKKQIKLQRICSSYNISKEDYFLLLKKQNNLCAICNKPETAKDRNGNQKVLAIDHNHKTGQVRGLLCQNCNTALGLLNEDKDILTNAIFYISNP